MYCKQCGKQIADDSVFCQYCGQELDSSSHISKMKKSINDEKSLKRDRVIEIPIIRINFSEKTKWVILSYSIWLVFHLYCLFAGKKSLMAANYFQPFSCKLDSDYSYYDISEFIIYVVGMPLAILGGMMFRKKYKDNDIYKLWTKRLRLIFIIFALIFAYIIMMVGAYEIIPGLAIEVYVIGVPLAILGIVVIGKWFKKNNIHRLCVKKPWLILFSIAIIFSLSLMIYKTCSSLSKNEKNDEYESNYGNYQQSIPTYTNEKSWKELSRQLDDMKNCYSNYLINNLPSEYDPY